MSGGRTGTERMTEKVDEIGKSGRVVQNLKYPFALLRTKPHNKGTLWSTAVTDLDVAKASGPTGQFCGHTFAPQCVRGHLFEIGVSESPHKGPMRARTAIKPQPERAFVGPCFSTCTHPHPESKLSQSWGSDSQTSCTLTWLVVVWVGREDLPGWPCS
jgi:hypothetical protein